MNEVAPSSLPPKGNQKKKNFLASVRTNQLSTRFLSAGEEPKVSPLRSLAKWKKGFKTFASFREHYVKEHVYFMMLGVQMIFFMPGSVLLWP